MGRCSTGGACIRASRCGGMRRWPLRKRGCQKAVTGMNPMTSDGLAMPPAGRPAPSLDRRMLAALRLPYARRRTGQSAASHGLSVAGAAGCKSGARSRGS